MGLFDSLKTMFSGFSGAGGDYYQKNFALNEGESVVTGTAGYFDPDPSTGEEAAALALSAVALVTGAWGGVRVVGEQFTVVITDQGRMIFGMVGGKPCTPIALGPDNKPSVKDTGCKGDRSMIGPTGKSESSSILRFTPQEGDAFRIIVAESTVPMFLDWAA